ncbi:hypothetical protein PICMEDRAFT_14494 [Pichia membranifaciens NRRL Y-2026]|uniref:Uncharacterized protein n=1 Tax=Pichia membranifaciens NRRL Y-2026 TaxID=763406 RepID=A0A1E3NS66_9ASCO|nr:hypothetical protein PICMEDRAFT_14494 [Pichia membranifaciens NRRL Y-2026]ODQ48987.1 hypothetical protein PICMEDRAFT_14494 [Pichia membranifaciens NRRL Y-2026]
MSCCMVVHLHSPRSTARSETKVRLALVFAGAGGNRRPSNSMIDRSINLLSVMNFNGGLEM